MTAEIISVGTELLLGNILNTNAQYLSRELADLGITVQRESTIGDNHGRLADFVNDNGFSVVVRGLRGMSDFDSEQQMAQLHQYLYNDKTETVFLMSDSKYAFISSTMAKQVISLGGRGDMLVPPCVLKKMKGRLNK